MRVGVPKEIKVHEYRVGLVPASVRELTHHGHEVLVETNAGAGCGFMDEDSDYPLWDDHHSVLIPRATAVGLIEVNDPTWEQAQEEYERQLMRMREDYEYERPQQQWAKSCWY